MNKIDLHYLAGFFDGEGYIGLHKHKDNRVKKGFTINAMVGITNTNKAILEQIRHTLPYGKIRKKSETKNNKIVYELIVQDLHGIESFLGHIRYDLIVKRKRAELMLKFCNLRKEFIDYTPAQMIIVNRIRKLNQRGKEVLGILPNFI